MRRILMICATASVLAACNGNSDLDTKKNVVVTDTSGMYKSNASTDTGTAKVVTPNPAPVQAQNPAPQAVTTTKTIIRERKVYVDRTPKAAPQSVRQAASAQPVGVVPQTTTTTTSTTTTAPAPASGTNTGVGTGAPATGSGTGTTTSSTTPAKNKGWSNAAKDATIGGVGGAIGGAVISRNKGKGAVLGGIIGAAGGYILGRKKDKKDTIK